MEMDLSIVIPVYNESHKIKHDIIAASNFLSNYGFTGEIIVVDDGSNDRSAETAKGCSVDEGVILKVLDYKEHAGKGYAVKMGIMEARTDLIMFIDSGNCVPYSNISRGIDLLKKDECDIAHGSRFLSNSLIKRSRKPHRKLASFLFQKYIRIFCHIPEHLTDTQCGLKIYKKKIAHDLYAACTTDGFMFDIEMILRAQSKGYRIKEFPIDWTSDPDSRLSVCKTLLKMFSELEAIRKVVK